MYTSEQLESKSLPELKEIGWRLNAMPDGDRRYRRNWIRAIEQAADRAADEFFASNEVNAAESEPEMSQSAIEQAAETSPGVEVDRVQDVIHQTWTSWEKDNCAWLKDAEWCVHQGQNKRIEAFLPTAKMVRLEGMKKGVEYCPIWEVSEPTYDLNGLEPLPVCCSSPYPQDAIAPAAKKSLDVEVNPVSEAIESKFGRIVYPRSAAKVEPAMSQSAIEQVAENSPGVEVAPVLEKHRFYLCLNDGPNVLWYDGKNFVDEQWSAKSYSKRGVAPAKHQLRSHPEVKRVFNSLGNVLQVVENFRAIASAAKTSPGAGVEQVQEPIASVAETSPGVESELASKFGRIVYPRPAAKVEPTMSQSAIEQAAENSPGVTQAQEPIECSADGYHFQQPDGRRYMYRGSLRFYIIEPTMQEAVDTNVYGEPDYPEWPDGWLSEPESDWKPLTSADAWNPAEFGEVLHAAEPSGQLNLLEWNVSEPPDPDDYDLMTDFHAAYDRWLTSSELEEIIHAKNDAPTGTIIGVSAPSVSSGCDFRPKHDGASCDLQDERLAGQKGDCLLEKAGLDSGDLRGTLPHQSDQLAPQAPIVPPQEAKTFPGVGVDLKIGMLVGRRRDRQHIGKILNIYQSRRGIWRAKIQPLNKPNFVYYDCSGLIEQRLLYDYEMGPGGFVLTGEVFNKARCEHFEVFSRQVRSPKPTNWTADELNSLSIFKLKQTGRDMEIPSIPGTAGKRSLIRAILAEQAILQERQTAQRERESSRAIVQKQKSAPTGGRKKRAPASLRGKQLSLFDVAV